jgi:trehalose/maltose hydrolase-like predicted phosphorylase
VATDDERSIDRWTIVVDPVAPTRRRAWEAIMTLGDGRFGTRGLSEVTGSPSWPATWAAGVYDGDDVPELLAGPLWAITDLEPDDGWDESAELDLRHAVVVNRFVHRTNRHRVVSTRFASLAHPGLMGFRVIGPVEAVVNGPPLLPPKRAGHAASAHSVDDGFLQIVVGGRRGAIAAVGTQFVEDADDRRTISRLAVYSAGKSDVSLSALAVSAREALATRIATGFDRLLDEHRAAWDRRWNIVGTEIDGQPDLDEGVKLAEFHLLSCGRHRSNAATDRDHGSDVDEDEVAIGARGLTGTAYRGHVFWDTDVFAVPALAALTPGTARAALTYRSNRLASARSRAQADGRAGARFPWESAEIGDDVTPCEGRDLHGTVIPILTGKLEEHIVADVAWAVATYELWTDDAQFMRTRGIEILTETARYWASRAEIDDDGSAHIRGVIGPDEYHERVNDNAFTNVMARFNLRTAADHGDRLGMVAEQERRSWLELAARFVDGLDPQTGVYEQFAGFHDLDHTVVSAIGDPPLSADALLGHDRIQHTQISKQPDVLMLHHMVPDEVGPSTLLPNLDVYLPLTAHGSSLSPAICSALLARAGRLDEAVHWFRIAARLDLDDRAHTTSGGVHIATMGGVWQALTSGFLGIRARQGGLTVDPHVPVDWGRVEHRFVYRNAPVVVELDGDDLKIRCGNDLPLILRDEIFTATTHRFRHTPHGWERQ